MIAETVCRSDLILKPNSGRVLIRPFLWDVPERVRRILDRVLALDDQAVRDALSDALSEFEQRHIDIRKILERHFQKVRAHLPDGVEVSAERRLLIGCCFTSEYALESAALFNPSIVPAPDQSGVPGGAVRFIMSLRAVGEGHISSIEFRSGLIDADGGIVYDPVTPYVTEPDRIENVAYDKNLFGRKLKEIEFDNEFGRRVLGRLGDEFTIPELDAAVEEAGAERFNDEELCCEHREARRTFDGMLMLAHSNYETQFRTGQSVSERIIFPSSPSERNGIEDARFVAFRENGSVIYYATYTAYDGRVILPQLIETRDFLRFKIITLNGPAALNKGMALFPRKIGGLYAMISRQDNENLFLMFSDNIHFWYDAQPLYRPRRSWEIIQIGNCGSPIETDAGWLVLTHGVGPMRKYCIGAILLDLDDPSKVIGCLDEPLLKPEGNEREGYVPNVVYTCGAMVHNGHLILPYAMSDYATAMATLPLDELLAHLTR